MHFTAADGTILVVAHVLPQENVPSDTPNDRFGPVAPNLSTAEREPGIQDRGKEQISEGDPVGECQRSVSFLAAVNVY
jgi:hypothetical protein